MQMKPKEKEKYDEEILESHLGCLLNEAKIRARKKANHAEGRILFLRLIS